MSTEAQKRKYDDFADDSNKDHSDDISKDLKRPKLGHGKSFEDSDAFHGLPKEIRYNIFSYLGWKDAVRLQAVSNSWYQETPNALEIMNLRAPDLIAARKTLSLLKKCPNISSFTQAEGAALGLELLPLKHLDRLKALHLSMCEAGSVNTLQLTKHLTALVELTCFVGIDDVEFLGLCKELSQRHLTKLSVQSSVLSNNALHHISQLTELKDLSLSWSYLFHDGLYSVTTNLRRLNLYRCSRIKTVDLQKFPNLESLAIVNVDLYVKLENLNHCTNLTQLKVHYKEPLQSLPVDQLVRLKDLELPILECIQKEEQISKLSVLANLTKLDFACLDTMIDILPYLAKLSHLKDLQFKSLSNQPTLNFNLEGLCNALPNLESLVLINFTLQQSVDISSLQHVTLLRLQCPSCSAPSPGLQHLPCHNISGIDSLTSLEVLELKICGYPSLSQLTRLRSLACRVNCHSQPGTAAQFIDHVANVPKLALERLVLLDVEAVAPLQSNISRLISLQTNLRTVQAVPERKPQKNVRPLHLKFRVHK